MSALLTVLFVAVLITGTCVQVVPLRLTGVTFRDTDAAHAWFLVAQYAEGTFEQRFGYPTGYFSVNDKRSTQPDRLVLSEAQPAGAVTDGCGQSLSALSVSGFETGAGAGCITFIAVSILAAPFYAVSFADRVFRFLLRSRVTVTIERQGPDSVAEFAFYGLGGYSLRRRYAAVFGEPTLPAAVDPAAVDPAVGAA